MVGGAEVIVHRCHHGIIGAFVGRRDDVRRLFRRMVTTMPEFRYGAMLVCVHFTDKSQANLRVGAVTLVLMRGLVAAVPFLLLLGTRRGAVAVDYSSQPLEDQGTDPLRDLSLSRPAVMELEDADGEDDGDGSYGHGYSQIHT